ncbi:MAG: inosine/xanthosine triphosphatase [Gemmatimonadota bacterium]|nr:inosine/xanthosine triphosphatase [Gemmatimonadota bacterium]
MPSIPEDVASVAVGSLNPVKVGATRAVLERLVTHLRIEGTRVASGVPDQPWGDEQTIAGARARAEAARRALDADWGVGIEGGVVAGADGSVRTCAWAVIVNRAGDAGVGGSLSLELPTRVAELVRGGMELGHAMDSVTGKHNVKQGLGAVGILTGGLVTRQAAYETLVAYALVPLLV